MTQAGMEFMFGLGRAALMRILDDIRRSFQYQDHHAFELGWQYCFHTLTAPADAGMTMLRLSL
jgi:hypothetical protein